MTGARIWAASDLTGGPLDGVFEGLRSEFPPLVIERLVMSHPGDDDNVYWLTIGPPPRLHGPETVQVDTGEGGCAPFLLEGERDDGEWAETKDPAAARSLLAAWLQRRLTP